MLGGRRLDLLAGAKVSGAFSGVPDQEILRQHGIQELPE
jgi:hypothetical protein